MCFPHNSTYAFCFVYMIPWVNDFIYVDYVVTSGIGGVYPGGLLIGSITRIQSATDGMTLNGEVDLFADIYNLKQVMVITSFTGQNEE